MLLRLVGGGPAKTTLTLLSPGASTGYTLLYPGLSFGDQTWTHEFSGARGTQGQRSAAGVVGNRTVTLPIRIAGTSKDDMNAKLAALERLVGEEIRRWGGLCAWQSNNQTPRQWFRVLTATTSIPSWDNRAEVINRALIVVTLVCAPPVEGDPLDLQDLFTPASAITDYTFDIGSAASMDTSAGRINFGNTSQVQFWHNLSGYAVSDVEVTMHYQVGAAAAVPGVFARRTVGSPLTGIVAQIDASGTNLGLGKVTAGTYAAQTGVGITTLVTAKDYWLRLRTEGQVAFAEHWTSQPTPQGSPAQSVSWTIAPADQATFGRTVKGYAGCRFVPSGSLAANFVDDLTVWPYTYRSHYSPRELDVLNVPGSLDPIADWWVFSPTQAHAFGLLGWARRPVDVYNWLWNGGFEYPFTTGGWSVAAVTSINNAATSINATGQVLYGAAAGRVVTPGSVAAEGTSFHMFRSFHRGVTYTFSIWVRSNTGAAQTLNLRLGVSGDLAISNAVSVPSSGAWVQATLTWNPTAERAEAYAAVITNGTSAYTWDMDGAMVYEGATAPTVQTQIQGRGGYPPIGVLFGPAAYSTTNWVITADAAALAGYSLQYAPSGLGAFSALAIWAIDPGLLWSDEYQQGSVDLEVWGRLNLSGDHSALTAQIYAFPIMATVLGPNVYTREYGSGTKTLYSPSPGTTNWRFMRLGTLNLPAGSASSPRNLWGVGLAVTGTAGVINKHIDLDHLLFVPARARCLSPSGANKSAGYPRLFQAVGVTTRVVKSDLSGFWGSQPVTTPTIDLAGTHGLGGSPIELPIEDHMVIPRVYVNIPEGEAGSDGDLSIANYIISTHLSITPRWQHARDV